MATRIWSGGTRRSGDVAVWFTDGFSAKQAPVIARAVPLAWEIAGIGDLDGDSKADLLWREMETGDLAAWLMSGVFVAQSVGVSSGVPLEWHVQ